MRGDSEVTPSEVTPSQPVESGLGRARTGMFPRSSDPCATARTTRPLPMGSGETCTAPPGLPEGAGLGAQAAQISPPPPEALEWGSHGNTLDQDIFGHIIMPRYD